jgi:hypothetical protein
MRITETEKVNFGIMSKTSGYAQKSIRNLLLIKGKAVNLQQR